MAEERPEPDFPKPWYYRPEYFVPAFFFPPVWSILVLRSPWNQSIIMGGIAWAILFVGGFLSFKWIQNGSEQNAIVLFLPGILLTLITQTQWVRYRAEIKARAESEARAEAASPPPTPSVEAPRAPRPSARRRGPRRRGR